MMGQTAGVRPGTDRCDADPQASGAAEGGGQRLVWRLCFFLFLELVTGGSGGQIANNPDAACVACHRAIVEAYARTPMARASGPAVSGYIPGALHHAGSNIDFRVFLRDDQPLVAYDRASPALHGEQRLSYFIGSNQRGRTFLYQQEGQWFEAPINFYSRKDAYDMAPNFGGVTSLPAPLPVDANCLHCHATAVQRALPEARNRFGGAPFLQAGIGCSACHGDPAAHLAAQAHGAGGGGGAMGMIVNPARLSPARRDSTCLQCHLEGDAAVFRAGTSPAGYRPGDDLDAYAVYFVKASAQAGGGRAASQYEALLRSACKAGTAGKPGAGDALTCTTCHDPHSTPANPVAFFRAKCLSCHTSPGLATTHHPEQPDCAACHMPTRNTVDISHTQSTDHNIQRTPAIANLRFASLGETTDLVPVGRATGSDRDLGLGYAQLAARGDQPAARRALALLERAAALPQAATDVPVQVQLGFLRQRAGDAGRARTAYETALRADPFEPAALGNLAVLDAATGRVEEAVTLLTRLVKADPAQTAAGLNLAFIQCRLGDKTHALATLETVGRFAPDDPTLRRFLATGTYGEQTCALR